MTLYTPKGVQTRATPCHLGITLNETVGLRPMVPCIVYEEGRKALRSRGRGSSALVEGLLTLKLTRVSDWRMGFCLFLLFVSLAIQHLVKEERATRKKQKCSKEHDTMLQLAKYLEACGRMGSLLA